MTIDGTAQRDDLFMWYTEEWKRGNRIKASKIKRVYEKMWVLYIKNA